mgnify:CR=1 FL=1
MAKKIAIKIDVDTKRGYDEGVPRMLDVFKQKISKLLSFSPWVLIILVKLFAVSFAKVF